jgi:hypothetical protein
MAKLNFSSRFDVFKGKIADKIAAHKLKKNYRKNKNGIAKEQTSKTVFFTVYMFLFIFQSFKFNNLNYIRVTPAPHL